MKKYEVVKEHKDFDDIIQNGRYVKNKFYIIYNKEREESFPKFGLAVGKKIGNAVTRNKVKRQLRMIIHNNKNIFQNNKDYIIIVKKAVLEISYSEMEQEFIGLIKK